MEILEKEQRIHSNIDNMRKSTQMIDAYKQKIKKEIDQIRRNAKTSLNTSIEIKKNMTTL
jgi:F0F1-type ATP synthase membrane subunit b/b'